MSWSRQPPVGDRVSISRDQDSSAFFSEVFGSGDIYALASGTAALAAALLAARANFPDVQRPKVIIPAYCCPDIVSAADFAGVQPMLVDLEPASPWMSLQALEDSIDDSVVAVIAVAFLGIRERLSEIRRIVNDRAVLIEDNAQYFPTDSVANDWYGDILVHSLGRGKPASILTGGLLVAVGSKVRKQVAVVLERTDERRFAAQTMMAKAALYNQLRRPMLYGLVSRLPFLNLGTTRYKTLQQVVALNASFLEFAGNSLRHYQSAVSREYVSTLLETLLTDLQPAFTSLSQRLGVKCGSSMIRYPVLANSHQRREDAAAVLNKCGLGASKMYEVSLPAVSGIAGRFGDATAYPEAHNFATTLLTLPTHSNISETHVRRIADALRSMG